MKTIGTCKECKFWGPMPAARTTGAGLDYFGKPNPPFVPDETTWRTCYFEGDDFGAAPMAEIGDIYGERTGIETSPDFGCVHFEKEI